MASYKMGPLPEEHHLMTDSERAPSPSISEYNEPRKTLPRSRSQNRHSRNVLKFGLALLLCVCSLIVIGLVVWPVLLPTLLEPLSSSVYSSASAYSSPSPSSSSSSSSSSSILTFYPQPSASLSPSEEKELNDTASGPAKDIAFFPASYSSLLSTSNDGQYLASPNGRYRLSITNLGALEFTELAEPPVAAAGSATTTSTTHSLIWWANSGKHRDRQYDLFLNQDGVLAVKLLKSSYNANADRDKEGGDDQKTDDPEKWETVWHSNLLYSCSSTRAKHKHVDKPSLSISNAGHLEIRPEHNPDQPICTLHSNTDRKPLAGRLAVVISGLYRTNNRTCASHVQRAIDTWPGKGVDVFFYTYETKDNGTDIRRRVADCYGSHLRDTRIDRLQDVREDFPPDIPDQCGSKLNRIQSQLKTVYNGYKLLLGYMLRTGTEYDYVLRLRPDHELPENADFTWLNVLEGTPRIILPHQQEDHYYYCPYANGDLGIGPTDQMAYGPPSLMGAWFDLYHHFAQIMTEGKKENAFRDYSGCETMPDGPEFETCAEPSHCGIECVMGWYLSLRGVKFQIDPSWKHELLRSDGKTRMARSPYHGSWD